MAQFVQVSDVEAAYEGTFTGREVWVQTVVDRAERLLLARRPGLVDRVTSGVLDVENVRDAVIAAVLRVVRNPEGLQSETEGNYLYSNSRDVAGGKLFFTGDDYALVDPLPSPGPRSVMVAIDRQRWRP